ncbi:uncharacterized protein LOC135955227 [Calliphora vicina]|uniref:uncharacterized protein LOC135955227 n=1 Tax=Calliphora vicina TaxID=7373 RepID=UPI00325AF354
MNHKISWDYIIFWSSILTFLVLSHTANGILTDSNDLHCTHIQCPTKCPADSYLKSSLDDEDEDFEDYDDELLGHDPFIEEIGHFEELPPEVELHDTHLPQHILKERQKREVFFQEEIERCCDDQKCVCNTCENVPKCAEGHVAIEVHEGQGVPGNCCSIYKCVKKEECKLGVKQSWWTSKCTKCSCFGESELCMQICPEEEILQNCYSEYLQKPMMNGAFWKEGSCTSCSCKQGDRRCVIPGCPKLACKHTTTLEDECCPTCLDDDETDERPEIVHNNAEDIEDVAEEYATESTTIDTPIIKLNEDHNSTIFIDNSNFPVIDDSIINESQTTSPELELKESSTVFINHETLEEIYSTFKPETEDLLMHSSSNTENETFVSVPKSVINSTLISVLENKTSTEQPISAVEQNLHSSLETSTEVPKSAEDSSLETSTNVPKAALDSSLETSTADSYTIVEVPLPTNSSTTEVAQIVQELDEDYSTTESTITEETKSKVMMEIEQDLSSTVSTTEEVVTSPDTSVTKTTTETPEESTSEETTAPESSITNTTEENLTTTSANYIEESSSIAGDMLSSTVSTTAAPIDFETTKALESSSENNHISTTTYQPPETTAAYSISYSTSAATESSESQESSSSINTISSPTLPKTTTNTPLDSTSTETSTQQAYSSSSSTSTTSSPFSTNQDDSTTSVTAASSIWEESTLSSTTTAPEPLKPLYQPYGDFNTEERTPSTQNQMRIIFDEIDYVVMIVLFIGSLLCISLGLIIRHTKNRKKMYSSIPNSETSLSQNSTNTVMTV